MNLIKPTPIRRRNDGNDGGNDNNNNSNSSRIFRPKAIKAIPPPIQPRMLVDFEAVCEANGIEQDDMRNGIQQAEEWHQKWTYQNHSQFELDRLGARNPSLSDSSSSECDNNDIMLDMDMGMGVAPREMGDHFVHHPHPIHFNQHPHPHPHMMPPTLQQHQHQLHHPMPVVVGPGPLVAPALLRPIPIRVSHQHQHHHVNHNQHHQPPPLLPPSPLHTGTVTGTGIPSQPSSPLTLPSEVHHVHIYHNHEEDTASSSLGSINSIPSIILQQPRPSIEAAKDNLLHALAISGGDVEAEAVNDALEPLVKFYQETEWDARDQMGVYSSTTARRLEGMWLTLSKPTFFGNLGESAAGDPMYTLGRMAFDMFLPTQLVCSLQGNFNPVRIVNTEDREALDCIPTSLKDEVAMGNSILRSYDIVTAFTIEPNLADFPKAPNKNVRRPIKGIMTVNGYILPDPSVPNRLSIWFTGGKIEPNDDPSDQREWKRFFGSHCDFDKRSLGEKVKLFAANLLMGAEPPKEMKEDGSMSFSFSKPIGGHGISYADIIYLDDTLRIVRGHRGTILYFTRIPDTE